MTLKQYLYAICVTIGVTVAFGTLYAAVQQDYRQSANDPQIAMAEDAANALKGGDVPASVVPRKPVLQPLAWHHSCPLSSC